MPPIDDTAATLEQVQSQNRHLTRELDKMTSWKDSNADAANIALKTITELRNTMAIMRDQAVQVLMSTELSANEINCLQNILRMSRQ